MARRLREVAELDREPTATELAAIDAEWPVTAAGLALLDAEIRIASALGEPSLMDWRRLRDAERQLLAAEARWVSCEMASAGAVSR